MRHIHPEFGFEIRFQLSANSSVTRDKGALLWQPILEQNCYKCISTRDIGNLVTYNRGFSWSANPKTTFLIARV